MCYVFIFIAVLIYKLIVCDYNINKKKKRVILLNEK